MKYFLPLLLALAPAIHAQNVAPHNAAPSLEQVNQMFFYQFDRDKNGTVNQAEFIAPRQEQFNYMDKNRDGKIDMSEVQTFTQEMMRYAQSQPRPQ